MYHIYIIYIIYILNIRIHRLRGIDKYFTVKESNYPPYEEIYIGIRIFFLIKRIVFLNVRGNYYVPVCLYVTKLLSKYED